MTGIGFTVTSTSNGVPGHPLDDAVILYVTEPLFTPSIEVSD
jgi:hypothetical protein